METLNFNVLELSGVITIRKCNLVKVILKGDEADIEVSALTSPQIVCLQLRTTINTHLYAHLEGLELADCSQSSENNSIKLIFYWVRV